MYLDEIVEEVARAERVLARPKNVSVQTATVPSAAFMGDEDLIRRLLVNLVDNAVRHAPEDTHGDDGARRRTALSTRSRSATPGRAFRRTSSRTSSSASIGAMRRARGSQPYDGAGLGLALARWIAREHGGDVVLADSSATGTTFVITLPRPA